MDLVPVLSWTTIVILSGSLCSVEVFEAFCFSRQFSREWVRKAERATEVKMHGKELQVGLLHFSLAVYGHLLTL